MTTYQVKLAEKDHTIKVQLAGYTNFEAIITVSDSGVVCVSVTSGVCGGLEVPRLDVPDKFSANVVMTPIPGGSSFADWIDDMGGPEGIDGNMNAVSVFIDGYLSDPGDVEYLGFEPTVWNVGTVIDYYLG